MILMTFQFINLGDSGLFILFILGVLIFVILSQIYSKKNRILRKLKEYSFKNIQQCKDFEYSKLKGNAFPMGEPLISPIGKRKCLYYKVEVLQKRSNGKTSHWHTLVDEEKSLDFILESNAQKALITTNIPKKDKRIHLIKDIEHSSRFGKDAPKFLEDYLKSHGANSTGLLGFNKSIRYREGAIEVGEKITVMGIGIWKESDHKFARYSSKSLVISGDAKNKLIITDDPKAQRKSKKK